MMVTLNMQDVLSEWRSGNPPLMANPPRITKWFSVFERQLATAGGGFMIAGATPTFADFHCYPSLVSRLDHLDTVEGVDKEQFPLLCAYVERMKALLAPTREKLVAKGYPMDP